MIKSIHDKFILVYCTINSLDQAKVIAKELVASKLAACVNITQNIHSIYGWNQSICEEIEIAMIIKTKKILFDKLKDKIITLHPYNTPCIISIPIMQIEEKFSNWINSQCL